MTESVKAIKNKRLEIENEICELYKEINLVIASGNYSNRDELNEVILIQRLCLNMLNSANR